METKARIIEEARSLFMEQGIKAVTMDDIASHLGISKRTIYEIFTDKTELLREALLFHFAEKQRHTFEEIKNRDAVESLFYMLEHIDAIAHNYKDFRLVQGIKKYYPQLHKEIIDTHTAEALSRSCLFIERGKAEKLFLETTSPQIASLLLHKQTRSFEPEQFASKEEAVDFFKQILITFFRGIATAEGVRRIDEKLANKETTEFINN